MVLDSVQEGRLIAYNDQAYSAPELSGEKKKKAVMKSQPQATKAKAAKVEAMKKIKAAYSQAKKEGKVKSYQISPNP